jgi:hypothetical protein
MLNACLSDSISYCCFKYIDFHICELTILLNFGIRERI